MESVGRLPRCLASDRSQRSRRGLSALEMVLSLPMLLFVMALMINYGTVASWKVRGDVTSRYAVWASRPPRTGLQFPQSASWPPPATLGAGGAADDSAMDDPRVDLPIARGLTLLDGTAVNSNLLDPALGFRAGTSSIQRAYPLMPKLGSYTLGSQANMLDDAWQYWQFGLWTNQDRRIPVIYILAQAPAGDSQAYVQAVMAIYNTFYGNPNPLSTGLLPLYKDVVWHGFHLQFPRWIGDSPDFEPQLPGFCSMDPTQVQPAVASFIQSIEGGPGQHSVAWTMTNAFIGMYQDVIRILQRQMKAKPPPSANQIAAMQAEIQQAQQEVSVLTKFLQTLP
ncbi:MAG: hypothetical protein ACLQNE_29570 [Thermoguttaceae bacterium]